MHPGVRISDCLVRIVHPGKRPAFEHGVSDRRVPTVFRFVAMTLLLSFKPRASGAHRITL